jgi:hypothetical protein
MLYLKYASGAVGGKLLTAYAGVWSIIQFSPRSGVASNAPQRLQQNPDLTRVVDCSGAICKARPILQIVSTPRLTSLQAPDRFAAHDCTDRTTLQLPGVERRIARPGK